MNTSVRVSVFGEWVCERGSIWSKWSHDGRETRSTREVFSKKVAFGLTMALMVIEYECDLCVTVNEGSEV